MTPTLKLFLACSRHKWQEVIQDNPWQARSTILQIQIKFATKFSIWHACQHWACEPLYLTHVLIAPPLHVRSGNISCEGCLPNLVGRLRAKHLGSRLDVPQTKHYRVETQHNGTNNDCCEALLSPRVSVREKEMSHELTQRAKHRSNTVSPHMHTLPRTLPATKQLCV